MVCLTLFLTSTVWGIFLQPDYSQTGFAEGVWYEVNSNGYNLGKKQENGPSLYIQFFAQEHGRWTGPTLYFGDELNPNAALNFYRQFLSKLKSQAQKRGLTNFKGIRIIDDPRSPVGQRRFITIVLERYDYNSGSVTLSIPRPATDKLFFAVAYHYLQMIDERLLFHEFQKDEDISSLLRTVEDLNKEFVDSIGLPRERNRLLRSIGNTLAGQGRTGKREEGYYTEQEIGIVHSWARGLYEELRTQDRSLSCLLAIQGTDPFAVAGP